ncbi:hypothetical protein ACFYZJ_28115 [Streptomyces sp. NPDC001848]|uniref:hypothetical protein n=1 Tax=Streptomyces sp. NPDC001848 TaxID=3364618 RepID=UPI00368B5719
MPVRLRPLDDDRFHDAIELLTTADSDSDAPGPGWLRPDHHHPLADNGAGNDGLPHEYAALEQEALEAETPAPRSGIPPATPQDTQATTPAASASGSLADVLALADDEPDEGTPAAGPADVSLALASPCTTPASAVHVTIPAPAEPAADRAAATCRRPAQRCRSRSPPHAPPEPVAASAAAASTARCC